MKHDAVQKIGQGPPSLDARVSLVLELARVVDERLLGGCNRGRELVDEATLVLREFAVRDAQTRC
ncbi:MAG: hypothetical protein Q8Q09_22235 [Deltaproteobacteria bacterium]|nr:hypothetical protein [Deltaproteobacteria bacterium]